MVFLGNDKALPYRAFMLHCWCNQTRKDGGISPSYSCQTVSCVYSRGQVIKFLVDVQTVVELFLGLRLKTCFPSARLPYTDSFPRGEGSDEEDSETDDPAFSAASSKVNTPYDASTNI